MADEKIYYSLRETIEATGVPAPTLRYWEKQFNQLSPRKDDMETGTTPARIRNSSSLSNTYAMN